MPKKLTNQEFVDKANKIHNNKFDYSKVNYQGNRYRVKIICSKHGEFNQFAKNHLKGVGCQKCALDISSKKAQDSRRLNTNDFITKAKLIHGDKFNYSLVDYKNNKTNIKIICSEHGVFKQTPSNHLRSGCEKCVHDNLKSNTFDLLKNRKRFMETFIFILQQLTLDAIQKWL